ncbi:MAG: hypothetical protein Q7U26_02790, partial [Aquabacterium sp.]|nr:hypothetical protein [Aquabacterium sp.]
MARADPTAAARADPATEAGDSVARDTSLWPDTARMRAGSASSLFEASRFDPLHRQKQRERWRLGTQFDLCRPALALRVLLFVQVAVALAALPLARGWVDGASRAAVLAFAALAASLLWLPAVCGLRGWLARWQPMPREGLLAGLGAVAAGLAWAMVAGLGLVPQR